MKPALYDAIIIGAGAAGLMCAITAGQRGRRVLVLDHADQAGKKILISGGGRCNFTNLEAPPERFISANPHFAKSALSRYMPQDFIALVEKHRIVYHEKTLGQLFCDGSAREIVAMLLAECVAAKVDIQLGHRITSLSKAERFRVETDAGVFEAGALVLATGGPSIPKMGATGFAYDVARQFGLAITEVRPALAPLTFSGAMLEFCKPLAGVAVEAAVQCGAQAFREGLLFTHRGLSGPSILQISSYWRRGQTLQIDLAPGHDPAAQLKLQRRDRPRAEAKTALAAFLPVRLADSIAALNGLKGQIANMGDAKLEVLAGMLKRWEVEPSGDEGFAKAEVTLGGVDTTGLSSKTMESKAVPGLYVIGEAVDVTGWLGGYNFQWAWSSGWAAGQSI
ncbi:MAG: NAD(P)/FAD-dependent oxidoreductase [Hyphomicrobiales bacterium]|nr:NAD(P)/FAD-dependent oxidoreductase [Hyphomicrobiales bacterium]